MRIAVAAVEQTIQRRISRKQVIVLHHTRHLDVSDASFEAPRESKRQFWSKASSTPMPNGVVRMEHIVFIVLVQIYGSSAVLEVGCLNMILQVFPYS